MARFFPIIPSRALQSILESLSEEKFSPSCLPKEELTSVYCPHLPKYTISSNYSLQTFHRISIFHDVL